eukprot:265346_1
MSILMQASFCRQLKFESVVSFCTIILKMLGYVVAVITTLVSLYKAYSMIMELNKEDVETIGNRVKQGIDLIVHFFKLLLETLKIRSHSNSHLQPSPHQHLQSPTRSHSHSSSPALSRSHSPARSHSHSHRHLQPSPHRHSQSPLRSYSSSPALSHSLSPPQCIGIDEKGRRLYKGRGNPPGIFRVTSSGNKVYVTDKYAITNDKENESTDSDDDSSSSTESSSLSTDSNDDSYRWQYGNRACMVNGIQSYDYDDIQFYDYDDKTAAYLESRYNNRKSGVFDIKVRGRTYSINFNAMTQSNPYTGRTRIIRRIPLSES